MPKVTVEPVVLLYSIGNTVQMSVQQDFIFSRLCRQYYTQQVCDDSWQPVVANQVSWVQASAVRHVMWMSVITSLIAVVSAQLLGTALDRYSRKTVMLVPFLGMVGLCLVCVLVAAIPALSLELLYLGAVLNGLAGGWVIFKASVSSYVVSLGRPGESATVRLSVVEAMVFLGGTVGPLALHVFDLHLTSQHDYLFLGSEVVIVVAIFYIVFFLPDLSVSCEKKPNRSLTSVTRGGGQCWSRLPVPVRQFGDAIFVTFRKRSSGIRAAILLLLLADFFIAIVFAAEFDLRYLYMQDKLGFTLAQYSQYLVVKNLVNGISLLAVLPVLRRTFRLSDGALGIMGGVSRVAAFTLLALTPSHTLVFIVPLLDVFGQYLFVVLRSIITSLVNQDEQGRVLSVMSSLAQVSLLVGSLIFDNVYPVFLAADRPGFTFLLSAVSMATATVILVIIERHLSRLRRDDERRPLLQ